MKKIKILFSLSLILFFHQSISFAQKSDSVKETQNLSTIGINQQLNISYDLSQRIVVEAQRIGKSLGKELTIAIVDRSAIPVLVGRSDKHSELHYEFALYKAKTAAMLKKPTEKNEEKGLRVFNFDKTNTLNGIQGGVPIFFNDQCIGAIGITGAPQEIDKEIAETALKIINQPLISGAEIKKNILYVEDEHCKEVALFYHDMIGVSYRKEITDNDYKWVEFNTGTTKLCIHHNNKGMEMPKSGSTHIVLYLDNQEQVNTLYQKFIDSNYKIKKIGKTDKVLKVGEISQLISWKTSKGESVKSFWVSDPVGNIVQIEPKHEE